MGTEKILTTVLGEYEGIVSDVALRIDKTIFEIRTPAVGPTKQALNDYFRQFDCDMLVIAYANPDSRVQAIEMVRDEIYNFWEINTVPIIVIVPEDQTSANTTKMLIGAGAQVVLSGNDLEYLNRYMAMLHRYRTKCFKAAVDRHKESQKKPYF